MARSLIWPAIAVLGAVLAGCGGGNEGTTAAPGSCFQGGAEELELFLPATNNKTVTVPKLPTDLAKYMYASDDALVAIPAPCTELHKAKLTKYTTLTDRSGRTGMAYFYIKDLEGGWESMKFFKDCSCGLVIEMHGSGGPGWTAVQFAALFSGMGYVEIILNSMAMPDDMGLKGRLPLKNIEEIDVTNYCGEYLAFNGSCGSFGKPYCYSTKIDNVLHNGDNYRKYVEGVYEIRKRELDWFLQNKGSDVLLDWPVFLVGNSEGAMAASRYHNDMLDGKLSGRIITAFSCDFTYFQSCAENAKICEDKCSKAVPQLNVIGENDKYFGATGYASVIAEAENGYGGPITGNCRKQYDAQQFETSTVVVMQDAGHGPSYYNDNTWRNVLADFLTNQGKSASNWPSLKTSCTEANGVYTCPMDGPVTCYTDPADKGYKVNPAATLNELRNFTCPAAAIMM